MEFLKDWIPLGLQIALLALVYLASVVGAKYKAAMQEVANLVKLYQASISAASEGGKMLSKREKSDLRKAFGRIVFTIIQIILFIFYGFHC